MEQQDSTPAPPREAVEAPGLRELQDVMRAHGISGVRIAVTGSSDQGRAELETVDPPEGRTVEVDGRTLEDFCSTFGPDTASDCYPGWELDDGGGGAIIVTPDEARLEMGWNDEKYDAQPPVLLPVTAGPLGLIREAMSEHGITEIRVQVSGYEDSGYGDLLRTMPPDMRSVAVGTQTLADICEAFAEEVATEYYPGWELDEGSAGTIDIRPDTARFEFGWRTESVAKEAPVFLVPEPPEPDEEVTP